jgi:hypothetical protein
MKFWSMLLLCIVPFVSHSEIIDFCKTIEFDTGAFDYSAIKRASSKEDCRDNPIPIIYNNIKDAFYLSPAASPSGGVSYLTWDDSTKKYSYDKFDLDGVIGGLVSKNVNFKYLKNLSYKVTINVEPKKNGNLVIGDVVFFDSTNQPISLMRTLFFYSQDNYAASYYSDPVKYSEHKKIDFINKLTSLFRSMVVNW